MKAINKVAVIGGGPMGGVVAAHLANAGVKVLWLSYRKAADRNALAGAVEQMLKTSPAPFMSKGAAKLIEVGNIDDDLGRVAECDWVIEAIMERLDLKQSLYRKLDAVRRPGTAVSSNTSTIPLAMLTEGMPETFRRDFLITHFFNPTRYMRLLEVVAGPDSDPATIDAVAQFADVALGKSVVRCNDSPGFIANRVGQPWMLATMAETVDAGLTVEEADAIIGKPMGIPKTGVFGLVDLVGVDIAMRSHHFDGEPAAEVGLLPQRQPRLHAHAPPQDDRRGLYGPQRHGRILSPEARRRREDQGGDRPQYGSNTGRNRRPTSRRRRTSPPCLRPIRNTAASPRAFWARRSATRRLSCRRRRPTSNRSMRRCGSATTGAGARSSLPT